MDARTDTLAWPSSVLRIRAVRLSVVAGPDARKVVYLQQDRVRVGTGERSDLRLTDPAVSRDHLLLVRTEQGFRVLDRGSRNGTWLGGARLSDAEITGTQRLRVGSTELLVEPLDEELKVDGSSAAPPAGMVGGSAPMQRIYALIERLAPTGLPVLITGETGTGKELVSRGLHARSDRRDGPFVIFDASSVPGNLIESELFGHTRGAFTGATEARPGAFERADGGTLLIDELGELSPALQTRLLRVLEAGEVKRLGAAEPVQVDVRVLSATNRDLKAEAAAGRFRDDLYYRVAVVEIPLPPLRDRLEDIPALASHLIATAPIPSPPTRVEPAFLEALAAWHWPGNVRELRNVLFRAAALANGTSIALADLPAALRSMAPHARAGLDVEEDRLVELPTAAQTWREARAEILEAFERAYLHDLLERAGGDLGRASDIAGLDRRTVRRLLRAHGLDVTTA